MLTLVLECPQCLQVSVLFQSGLLSTSVFLTLFISLAEVKRLLVIEGCPHLHVSPLVGQLDLVEVAESFALFLALTLALITEVDRWELRVASSP